MKKALLIFMVLGLGACTTLAPPRPPVIDDSPEGMRPINPSMLSSEALAAWERDISEEQAKQLREAEAADVREN